MPNAYVGPARRRSTGAAHDGRRSRSGTGATLDRRARPADRPAAHGIVLRRSLQRGRPADERRRRRARARRVAAPRGLPRLLAGVRADGRAVTLDEHLAPLRPGRRETRGGPAAARPRRRCRRERPARPRRRRASRRHASSRRSRRSAAAGRRRQRRPRASPPSGKDKVLLALRCRTSCSTAPRSPLRRSAPARRSSPSDAAAHAARSRARSRSVVARTSRRRHAARRPRPGPLRRRRGDRARQLPERRAGEADVHAAAPVRARRRRRADARPERRDARAPRADRALRRRAGSARSARADEPGSVARHALAARSASRASTRSPLGTPLRELVAQAGGATAEPIRAFLVGGYFGTWMPAADALAAPLSNADLGAARRLARRPRDRRAAGGLLRRSSRRRASRATSPARAPGSAARACYGLAGDRRRHACRSRAEASRRRTPRASSAGCGRSRVAAPAAIRTAPSASSRARSRVFARRGRAARRARPLQRARHAARPAVAAHRRPEALR